MTSSHLSDPVVIPTASLVEGYSPRLIRLDLEHVRTLAEVVDVLPPIVVDAASMRVLDGLHRLAAHRLANRTEIRATLFYGSELEALALAIRANVRHGRPLSLSERRAGAQELLRQCPERSDRWLGDVCGISHSTVAKLRMGLAQPPAPIRIGRDGRRRAVDRRPAARPDRAADTGEERNAAVVDIREAAGAVSAPALSPELYSWLQKVDFNQPTDVLRLPDHLVAEAAEECRRRSARWLLLSEALVARADTDHSVHGRRGRHP